MNTVVRGRFHFVSFTCLLGGLWTGALSWFCCIFTGGFWFSSMRVDPKRPRYIIVPAFVATSNLSPSPPLLRYGPDEPRHDFYSNPGLNGSVPLCHCVPARRCFFFFLAVRGSIIYNIVDTSSTGVAVGEGGVLVGVHAEDGTQVITDRTHQTCDVSD